MKDKLINIKVTDSQREWLKAKADKDQNKPKGKGKVSKLLLKPHLKALKKLEG